MTGLKGLIYFFMLTKEILCYGVYKDLYYGATMESLYFYFIFFSLYFKEQLTYSLISSSLVRTLVNVQCSITDVLLVLQLISVL